MGISDPRKRTCSTKKTLEEIEREYKVQGKFSEEHWRSREEEKLAELNQLQQLEQERLTEPRRQVMGEFEPTRLAEMNRTSEKKYCPVCGQEVSEDDRICPCGGHTLL